MQRFACLSTSDGDSRQAASRTSGNLCCCRRWWQFRLIGLDRYIVKDLQNISWCENGANFARLRLMYQSYCAWGPWDPASALAPTLVAFLCSLVSLSSVNNLSFAAAHWLHLCCRRWIAQLFLWGSMCWCVNGIFLFCPPVSNENVLLYVTGYTALAGGTLFWIGRTPVAGSCAHVQAQHVIPRAGSHSTVSRSVQEHTSVLWRPSTREWRWGPSSMHCSPLCEGTCL